MLCYDFEPTSAWTKVIAALNESLESNKGSRNLKRDAISGEKMSELD